MHGDDDSPFADLPRHPCPPADEPPAWLDTAAENLAHAGPTLAAGGVAILAAGTLVYGLLLVFGPCGWLCSLGVAALAAARWRCSAAPRGGDKAGPPGR